MSGLKQIVVQFNGRRQAAYLVDVDEVFIGRGRSAHIPLDDNPMVSRKHAVIRSEGGAHVLSDLGGPNGTFVNDERITSVRLKDGDRITLGKHTMKYEAGTPGAVSIKARVARAEAEGGLSTGGMSAVPEPAVDPHAAPWERPKRRAPAAVAGSSGSLLGNSEATMAASKDELEALVAQMKIKSGPHVSVPHEGQLKLISINEKAGLKIGWTEECEVRLPGAVWFNKTAATIKKRKGKWWIDNHQPFWRSIQIGTGKLAKKRKLAANTVITIDKVKIRFSPGETT